MTLRRYEWPGRVLDNMSEGIVATAQAFRLITGCPMIPSPLDAAHVRFEDGTSRHAVGEDGTMRLADATDLYLTNNRDAPAAWQLGQRVEDIGGFGIYFDTIYGGEPRVLFHIDRRPGRLMWVCPWRDRNTQKREYIYFRKGNPGPYLDFLVDGFKRLSRG